MRVVCSERGFAAPATAHADGPIRPSSVRFAATFSQWEKEDEGEIDHGFLITHKIGLEDGPDAYTMVQEKNDGCIKVVINP